MKKAIAFVLIASFLTSGCGSIFHGTDETVHLRSEEPDTVFFADNRKLGTGKSAVTSIPKKELAQTTLRAEKEGCCTKTTPIETRFDAVTLLGILLDLGIISILVVDWGATGAVTKAAQTDYILTPECPELV